MENKPFESILNYLKDQNVIGKEEFDYLNNDETAAKKKILDNVHNGEVMLLHATSKTNANILGEVIKEIKNMGYEFKSLDEFK